MATKQGRATDPKELGRRGEVLALGWLMGAGYHVIERNWRCGIGELDVVATQGGDMVAVEVKTRSGRGFGEPAEAVGREKLARLNRLIHAWCCDHGQPKLPRRVDVLALLWPHDTAVPESVEIYRGVTL